MRGPVIPDTVVPAMPMIAIRESNGSGRLATRVAMFAIRLYHAIIGPDDA